MKRATRIGRTAREMTDNQELRWLIRDQPGYRPGQEMRVMLTVGSTPSRRAYRLYVWVGARWMDGSLADM